jgi:hypothetical protein
MRLSTIVLFIITATAFGCLMAARDMLDSIWLRALVAALAFGGFALAATWLQRRASEIASPSSEDSLA